MLARSNKIPFTRVEEVLGLVGLADVAGKRTGGYSLGMSQRLGIPLARIREALATLPTNPGPTSKDWARLSAGWRSDLDERILVTLAVARYGAARMRAPGTLLFLGGTGSRHIAVGMKPAAGGGPPFVWSIE